MTARKLILMPLLLLAACGPKMGAPGSAVTIVKQADLPPPTIADTQGSRAYLIGPHDKLSVEVFGAEDLGRKEVQVDGAGKLSYPLVGMVDAGGKTPYELEDLLEQRLRGRYMRDPQVTVNLKETRSQTVTVEGKVQQPGIFPVIGNMTLLRAVASANGMAEYASTDVAVFRTVNGQKMGALYNIKAIRKGLISDPAIYANDIVVVGDSESRRFFEKALTAISTLSYPLVVIFGP